MRLTARVPADLGRVVAVTVRLEYEGTETTDGVDVTDVQLQVGDVTGVVPHPSDLDVRAGPREWRNGSVPRSADEVIVLANNDRAAPTRIDVRPSRAGAVRVGSFRFGHLIGPEWADGEAAEASTGWGRVPVLTERSDGHVAVTADHPLHLTVGWSDRP